MKTRYEDKILLRGTLNREAAEGLLKTVKGNTDFANVVSDIEQQLKPWFSCNVTCCGCGNKKETWSQKKVTKEELKKVEEYWLCGPCMDSEDFKWMMLRAIE